MDNTCRYEISAKQKLNREITLLIILVRRINLQNTDHLRTPFYFSTSS